MRRFLLAIVAVMGLAGPALAQVSQEWVRCVNESGTYYRRSLSLPVRP